MTIVTAFMPLSAIACETPTMAQFKQLKLQMSIEQVQKIMGCEGDLMSESAIADQNFKIINFNSGSAFSNVVAQFANDKLMGRTQVGLK